MHGRVWVFRSWLDNGCLQDLSRDGDASVSTSLLPLWLEAGMPERRDQILAEVEARWTSRDLQCWDDFWRDDFLLPYDEHAPLQEGREDAQAEVIEEDALRVMVIKQTPKWALSKLAPIRSAMSSRP